ncbi:hypothetical protein BDN71DRAFT_1585939 [Pleurotus eryngii]|uniref:Uncharacterized protein n=1 Tax=Pleurotus eryngii TaxID=5323 RepID=A0A9P6A5J1_PLEER|nr:hypothetical protein BDN71DRAFT_1585939 [Pleurotus eryngii]
MASSRYPPGVRHLTLRQVAQTTRQHSDAPFKLNNVAIAKSVIVIANVVGSERKEKSIFYDLDDGTWGRAIQGKRWFHGDEAEVLELEHLQYVRVLGRLDHFTISPGNIRKSLNIDTIQPIENPHEVLYHILRTMAEPLVMAHGPPPPDAWSKQPNELLDQKLDQELARETHKLVVSGPSKPPTPPSRPASTSPRKPLPRLSLIQSQASGSASTTTEASIHSDPLSGLTDLQREIMLCIMRDNSANIQSNHIYPNLSLGVLSSTHWVSLDVPMSSIQNNPRHRDVSSTEFIGAMDFLVSNGYLKESPKGDFFSVPQPRRP